MSSATPKAIAARAQKAVVFFAVVGVSMRQVSSAAPRADIRTDTQFQIADRLVRSHRTVQNHVQSTLRKLHMHNRVELTRFAIEHGLDAESPG